MSQKSKLGDALYQFSKTRRFKLLLFGLLIFLGFWFVFSLRTVFIPVLIGGLIAYILEPLVKLVSKTGLSRLASILIIYVSMIFLTTTMLTATSIALTRQVQQLANSIEEDVMGDDPVKPQIDHNGNGKYDMGYRKSFEKEMDKWVDRWNVRFASVKSLEIKKDILKEIVIENFKTTESEEKQDFHIVKWLVNKGANSTADIVVFVTILIMIPIYAFLLQRLMPQMTERIPGLIPMDFRERTLSIMSKINLEISAFFRGKLMVCFLKGLFTWIGLSIIGVNYAFFIGFLAGGLSVIPYLGAVIGFLLASLLTILDKGADPLLKITFVFVLMEIVEFGLHILIFGKEVGVHPLAFILALFIGGSLFGVFGVIMAVPLLSVATILWKEFVTPLIEDLALPKTMPEDVEAEEV